jgi:hypothetical protein
MDGDKITEKHGDHHTKEKGDLHINVKTNIKPFMED